MLNIVSNYVEKYKKNLLKTKKHSSPFSYIYKIVSTSEEAAGEVKLKVQVVGQKTVFIKSIKEIYEDKNYLDKFHPKDISYIGLIYGLEKGGNAKYIKNIPINSIYSYKNLPIISMLFITTLLLSNFTGAKLVEIYGITLPAAIFFFPFTYIFDDILTEVYGFKQSRRVIWMGMICNLIFILGTQITISLPSSSHWLLQEELSQIMGALPRTIIASMIAYFFGEFLNSYILAKLKILSQGRHFWIRAISSTAIGVAVDSILFILIAFAFTIPWSTITMLILTQYIIKLSYEIIVLPLTIAVTAYLKKIEQSDYYDYNTNFTPFSLSLEEDVESNNVIPLKTEARLH